MNIFRRSTLAWCMIVVVLSDWVQADEHDYYYADEERIALEVLPEYLSYVTPKLDAEAFAQIADDYPALEVVEIPLAAERYKVHLVRSKAKDPDRDFDVAVQTFEGEPGVEKHDDVFRAKETIMYLSGEFTVEFAQDYAKVLRNADPQKYLVEILDLGPGSTVERDEKRPGKMRFKVRFGGIRATDGIPRINRINGRPEIWGAWPDFIRLITPPIDTRDNTTKAGTPRKVAPGQVQAQALLAAGACSGSPNDPKFGLQWALENTPEPPPADCPSDNVDEGYCDSDIDWADAWEAAQSAAALGKPTIAVLDNGVQRHEDLDLVIPGIDATGQGNWEPSHWQRNHGTRAAGVAGAVVGNCTGVAGAAVSARILPVKIFNYDLPDPLLPDVAGQGIIDAALCCARVLNNSWGHDGADDADVISALDTVVERDALFVVAAGNILSGDCSYDEGEGEGEAGQTCTPTDVKFPATLAAHPDRCVRDHVVAVSATNQRDEFKTVEAYVGIPYEASTAGSISWGSRYGPEVDLAAPAEELWTTDTDQVDLVSDQYSFNFSKTSAAAPVVSGAAATLFSFHPTATATQVKRWMLNTTDPGHDQTVNSVSGRPDKDDYLGHGRLNLSAALIRANTEMVMATSYQPQAGIDVAVERRNTRIKDGESRHVVVRIMQDNGQGQLVPVIDQPVTFSLGGWFGRAPLDLLTPENAAATTDCDGIAVATIRGDSWLIWGGKVTATVGGDSDTERVTVPGLSTWTLLLLSAFVIAVIVRSEARRDA